VGDSSFIQQFISDNKLEDQLILIGNRSDINEIYKRIDIYINTYPYGGGLMIQYALLHKKAILALNKPALYYTRIDKVIDKELGEEYIISSPEKFIQTANKLIQDKAYRQEYTDALSSKYDIHKVFDEILTALLHGKFVPVSKIDYIDIDIKEVARFHIESDNSYVSQYFSVKYKYLKDFNKLYFQRLRVLHKIYRILN
jgi:hypothetical protein